MVSIILPTYNEKENIKELIDSILMESKFHLEINVVDDDSPDRTWQVVEEIIKINHNVKLLRRIGKRGLTSAITDGILISKGEIIVWMDTDLSMPVKIIPDLVNALKDCDIAIGSRYVKGAKDLRGSLIAILGSRLINLFAGLILGFSIKDYTTGFLAIRRNVLEKINLSGRYGEYCIDFLYRLKKRGFRIKELPYICSPRKYGKSKTISNPWVYLRHIIRYIFTILKLKLSKV